jgi:Flp pilus assembly protein TadG
MRTVTTFFKSARRVVCGEEGSSLVETALASSAFFAMLIGTFQVSLALYASHFVDEAAREASRYAMVRGGTSCTNTPNLSNCNVTSAQIQTYVRGLGYPGVTASNVNVTTTWLSASASQPTTWSACANQCNSPGNLVKVVATYPFTISIPLVPNLSFSLTSTSSSVISQ